MAQDPICPCDGEPSERTIDNPPARDRIAYRVGDFLSFRHALLSALTDDPPGPVPKETQLTDWRPTAEADLGVQMLEWWAYLADILTFYNERIANESYLRTATRPESLNRLIRTLGYRPRPGIAAHGDLAALVGGHRPVTLPRGFSVDSKPGPGESPQTFELDAETVVNPSGTVPADPPALAFSPDPASFLLAGTKSPLKAGSAVMLDARAPNFSPLLLVVGNVQTETGTDGGARTRVTFTAPAAPRCDLPARDLMMLQATQTMPASSIDPSAVSASTIHLAGLARDIHAGDFVLFTAPNRAQLCQIKSVTDVLWYANHKTGLKPVSVQTAIGTGKSRPSELILAEYGPADPPEPPKVPIAIMHSVLTLVAPLANWPTTLGATTVGFGWRSVGELLDQPVDTYTGAPGTLIARVPAAFPDSGEASILIADAVGAGMEGLGSSVDGQTLAVAGLPQPATTLRTPLTVHFNLLSVSRGKTVPSEVLGSGDASVAGQAFVLKKSPLTYLAAGDGFTSTLQVWVNGRLWQEAASFYGQPADAEIYVTSEDEDAKTHVSFGDGVNGARLPTGVNNVTAVYRYGSGAKAPGAGALTVIGKPQPNLKSLVNPVAVGGGADPDPPDQIRRFAPRSVMTFGRAISGDDYQVIAAQAPGVTRTQAVWSFDADEQRSTVKIYVGDNRAAVAAAKVAIAATADPHRRVLIVSATPISITLSVHLLIDPIHQEPAVIAAVTAALLDDDLGVFGTRRLGIGEAVFDSQISAACLACDGVVAVHAIRLAPRRIIAGQVIQFASRSIAGQALQLTINRSSVGTTERHSPGEGAFYTLDASRLTITSEVTQHDG
jgi:hypothetical protein